eukprot:378311-Pyramimonas_sp.AAC.1
MKKDGAPFGVYLGNGTLQGANGSGRSLARQGRVRRRNYLSSPMPKGVRRASSVHARNRA